jgi:acyl transferase domain-containing protein
MQGTSSGYDIAVIGMAGHFPGAGNPDAFWQNLRRGVESVKFFSDDKLLAAGASSA